MLNSLTLILCCQLAGELTVKATGITAPGPVIGMLFLLVILLLKGSVQNELETTANSLLNNLSLLFVPAGVGLMLHFQLIGKEWLPITISLIISTILTIAITGLMMVWLSNDNSDETLSKQNNKNKGLNE
ncbi:MAG: murein hydrolase transporter LrgA [Methyloligella sp.]|nr:MAG: murein hydrolase transporter LrgA [Methyloligella sp.]